ncbi:MAG: hypothetical protein K8R53_13575 [Bacteroidales bacterium]|nr:hypothetical protein [Bacteroidales bacterium]
MNRSYFLIFLLFISCVPRDSVNEDRALARVFDEYLYVHDLVAVVPEGTAIKDSIILVKNYVNNWIQQQLLLDIANKNLKTDDQRFEKQLEDYKNSLLIYEYESKFVKQNLSTTISDVEIEDYFSENIENFRLKTNIVRAIYARFLKTDRVNDKVIGFFHSNRPASLDSLDFYFVNFAESYNLNDEKWMLFDDLLKYIPITTNNKEAFLRNNRKVFVEDDVYKYYVLFTENKLVDELPPLGFEKENIRQIIINRRKVRFIKKLHKDIFDKAMENNDFEIY